MLFFTKLYYFCLNYCSFLEGLLFNVKNKPDNLIYGKQRERICANCAGEQRRIYTVCYMFSNDTEQVNDLFQDILINIWNGLKSFEGDKHPSTCIWKVSLNTCINYTKKNKNEIPTLPLDVSFNLYEDTDDDSLQIKQLYNRINKLGFIDRSMILMWRENISYDEI